MRKRVRVSVTQSKDFICNHIKTEKSCEILTFFPFHHKWLKVPMTLEFIF